MSQSSGGALRVWNLLGGLGACPRILLKNGFGKMHFQYVFEAASGINRDHIFGLLYMFVLCVNSSIVWVKFCVDNENV